MYEGSATGSSFVLAEVILEGDLDTYSDAVYSGSVSYFLGMYTLGIYYFTDEFWGGQLCTFRTCVEKCLVFLWDTVYEYLQINKSRFVIDQIYNLCCLNGLPLKFDLMLMLDAAS